MKKLFRKKKSPLGTAAKILIPAAGILAAKKLWDSKDTFSSDSVRSKILEKTEAVQDKIQQFHDFVQNSTEESAEDIFTDSDVNTDTEETIFADETINETMNETINANTTTGEDTNVDEGPAEDAENTEDTEETTENNA